MKRSILAVAMAALFAGAVPVSAADDGMLARMALCKDSWLEWSKANPAQFKAFAEHVKASFTSHGNDPFAVPKAKVSVAGLSVTQAFPDSIGMGVGFSLTLAATFDDTRKAAETALGKKLEHCEADEGMRSCELTIAPQRTVTVMSDDKPGSKQTLLGCYYLYEK